MELSVEEAATRLGVTLEAVRARLRRGALSGRREAQGRRQVWLIPEEAVEEWLAERRRMLQPLVGPLGTTPMDNLDNVFRFDRSAASTIPNGVEGRPKELDTYGDAVELRRQISVLKEAIRIILSD